MQPTIEPTAIAIHGINTVTDRYLFRAVVIEAIRTTVEHVDPDIVENELRAAYNAIVTE